MKLVICDYTNKIERETMKKIIVIGSDHAGFKAKEYTKTLLKKMRLLVIDKGTYGEESVDYPDYAEAVAKAVRRKKNNRGILMCSTGIGISIAANKVSGIRAALVTDARAARMSREHNDANILVLAGNPLNKKKIKNILSIWLTTRFQGGRHARRVKKITKIEKKYLS